MCLFPKLKVIQKVYKDFTLADTQEGIVIFQLGTISTLPVGSQVTYLANQEKQMIKSHYTCSIPKHFRYNLCLSKHLLY